MNLKRKLSVVLLALSAAMPMMLTTTAHAQTFSSTPTVSVTAFDVEQLRTITPGSELEFRVNGTPGAEVTLQIAGATDGLSLTEVQAGRYTGTYTVRSRDRLTAASLVTARLVKNGEAVSVSLDESLVIGASSPVPVAAAQIDAFTVSAPDRIRAGDEMEFSLTGAAGGKARAVVSGVTKPIVLTETSRGVYEGSYTVRRRDRLEKKLVATGYLVLNKRETSQRFARAQGEGRDTSRRDSRDDRSAVASCADCGVVESVKLVEVDKQSPNILGTIAGGVVGGLLGNQVGGGDGKKLATIAGAVGGAYAGNRIENSMGKTKEYRVAVKLQSGAIRTFAYAEDPAVQVGARVRVENDQLVRQ